MPVLQAILSLANPQQDPSERSAADGEEGHGSDDVVPLVTIRLGRDASQPIKTDPTHTGQPIETDAAQQIACDLTNLFCDDASNEETLTLAKIDYSDLEEKFELPVAEPGSSDFDASIDDEDRVTQVKEESEEMTDLDTKTDTPLGHFGSRPGNSLHTHYMDSGQLFSEVVASVSTDSASEAGDLLPTSDPVVQLLNYWDSDLPDGSSLPGLPS